MLKKIQILCNKIASQKVFWLKPAETDSPSKLFNRRDLLAMVGWSQRLMNFDNELLKRLSDRRIRGIRNWEYGNLLGYLWKKQNIGNWQVLDVGPGDSTFPLYLNKLVGHMTTIDYPSPLEKPSRARIAKWKKNGITVDKGSMLELPYEDGSFDLVTCISVIEHLDDMGNGKQYSYSEFINRTEKGLAEMARVVKKGGYLYITSDAFVPDLQDVDNWSRKRKPGNKIWSAFRLNDINDVFVKTITKNNLTIIGRKDYSLKQLVSDKNRSSYRGRYFSTFAILVRKNNP